MNRRGSAQRIERMRFNIGINLTPFTIGVMERCGIACQNLGTRNISVEDIIARRKEENMGVA